MKLTLTKEGSARTIPFGPKVLLTRSAIAMAPMKEACGSKQSRSHECTHQLGKAGAKFFVQLVLAAEKHDKLEILAVSSRDAW